MTALFATALLYLACFAFHQAGERRAFFALLKNSRAARRTAAGAGWLLAMSSLYAFSSVEGWERGVPVWLGVFTLAGAAVLLSGALAPPALKWSGPAAAAAALVAAFAALASPGGGA